MSYLCIRNQGIVPRQLKYQAADKMNEAWVMTNEIIENNEEE